MLVLLLSKQQTTWINRSIIFGLFSIKVPVLSFIVVLLTESFSELTLAFRML